MAKKINSKVHDYGFQYPKGGTASVGATITYTLCSAEPTTITEANTTYMLATTTLNKASEMTIAAGDAGGTSRKITFSAKTGISVTNGGTANHVCVHDGTDILFVDTTASQAVSAGGTVDIGSWKVETGTIS